MVRVYYSPKFVGSGYDLETTRKAKWIADSLASSPISGVELVEPALLTDSQISAVHDPEYVRAIRIGLPKLLAESQGFIPWDESLWPMVQASNGGVVAAAFDALEQGVAGSLSSGLHHAKYGHGDGFCTFNGLVIAAHAALTAGCQSVLILDLDAHCGGGTASLIANEPRIRQLDVSISRFDNYHETSQSRLEIVENDSEYLATVRQILDEEDRKGHEYDLCLYNAGMDPILAGITEAMLAERERMVFEWCGGRRLPIAFVLAGGYIGHNLDEQGLVALHRLTLLAASRVDAEKNNFYGDIKLGMLQNSNRLTPHLGRLPQGKREPNLMGFSSRWIVRGLKRTITGRTILLYFTTPTL